MRILVCGHRAYAARGLVKLLQSKGYDVVCFSRDKEGKETVTTMPKGERNVTGNVLKIDENTYLLSEKIDVIINFILLEDASEEDNLRYAEALCRFASKIRAKKLIHMSSISCYANDERLISERTSIDPHPEMKGRYGTIKIKVDNILEGFKMDTRLVMMRPGFITAPDKKNALAGIAKVLPCGFAILMGDKGSTLPLCERNVLHKAMLDAIESQVPKDVYLLVGKGHGTKYSYLKQMMPDVHVVLMPKCLVIGLAKALKIINVFDEKQYQMVRGLFKRQTFEGNF